MDQRLSLITLAAEDVHASRAFYERLGWSAGFHNDDVAFFQLNGFVLGLYRREAFEAELGRKMVPSQGFSLAHNVPDKGAVDDVLDALVAAGGSLLHDAVDRPWGGRSGYAADPDGHAWEVAWNPDWGIDQDGDTIMVIKD